MFARSCYGCVIWRCAIRLKAIVFCLSGLKFVVKRYCAVMFARSWYGVVNWFGDAPSVGGRRLPLLCARTGRDARARAAARRRRLIRLLSIKVIELWRKTYFYYKKHLGSLWLQIIVSYSKCFTGAHGS